MPWITRISETDRNMNSWVQLPGLLFRLLHIDGLYLRFNFDENVSFPQIELRQCFYKHALQCFNKAYVSDKSCFEKKCFKPAFMGQPIFNTN